jgi:hypothetical protein
MRHCFAEQDNDHSVVPPLFPTEQGRATMSCQVTKITFLAIRTRSAPSSANKSVGRIYGDAPLPQS